MPSNRLETPQPKNGIILWQNLGENLHLFELLLLLLLEQADSLAAFVDNEAHNDG